MIGPVPPIRGSMASGAVQPSPGSPLVSAAGQPGGGSRRPPLNASPPPEPVLCNHCGRTASNGISCQGICVADSGY